MSQPTSLVQSAPSSPVTSQASPQTSPLIEPPSSPPDVSPATSPVQVHSSGASLQSSSSSGCQPNRKRRCLTGSNKLVSRSTLERRLRAAFNSDSGSEDNESVLEELSQSLYHQEYNAEDVVAQENHSDSDTSSLSEIVERGSDLESESDVGSDSVSEPSILTSSDGESATLSAASARDDVSELSVNYLFEGSCLTVDQTILKVLKLYLKMCWTKTSLDGTVKLIRDLLPKGNNMPTSAETILNRLNEVAPFQIEIEHCYCRDCHFPVKNVAESCCNCTSTDIDIFFEYPIGPQLKYLFEHRDLASIMDTHCFNRVKKDKCISNIQDGSVYFEIKTKLEGQYDIILMLNSDGVSVSKSSKQEVWSILCTICEVPEFLRSSYMLLCGVFVSKTSKKPRMNTFLKPFVDSINKINNAGGFKWIHPQSKQERSSKIVCPIVCADAPAKAYILNVKPFSHKYGCNVCEQKSKRVELSPAELALNLNLPPKKRKRPVRRFIYQEEGAPLRTGQRMVLQGRLAEERKSSRKGVVGKSIVCELPFLDQALCICAEYLHVVCLGVVRYFLDLMFNVRGPWYIGDHLSEIDEFLTSIKVPDFVTRLPRGISNLKFLIGSELRSVLLFYSLPAFRDYLPEDYFQHWLLLVGSIYLLLQEHIPEDDLNRAELMLRLFVREIHDLYGDKYYTYNVHNLIHLRLLVERWGNLFSTSAFDFEKFNGFIMRHVPGTKHIGRELLNVVKRVQSVKVFEGVVNASEVIQKYNNNLTDLEFCGKPLSREVLTNAEQQAITSLNINIYRLYNRVKLKAVVFTLRNYDEDKKRANSYVQLSNKLPVSNKPCHSYGQILYFVEDSETKSVFCVIDKFRVIHTDIIYHLESRMKIGHLIPVESTGHVAVFNINSIVTKVIKAGRYLCLRPNPYEINL